MVWVVVRVKVRAAVRAANMVIVSVLRPGKIKY